MEESGSVRARNTEPGNQREDRRDLLSTKPLHRFVQRDPKSFGIILLIFGSAELLMGFLLAGDMIEITSSYLYIPFWQGVLFLTCGILSIYTGIHPSKKMVTVCLAMYVVSFIGLLVSVGSRIFFLLILDVSRYRKGFSQFPVPDERGFMLIAIEAALFVSSLCASVLLILLCCASRLALKSTRTQVVLHQIAPPVSDTN